jgi:hypothetical protein
MIHAARRQQEELAAAAAGSPHPAGNLAADIDRELERRFGALPRDNNTTATSRQPAGNQPATRKRRKQANPHDNEHDHEPTSPQPAGNLPATRKEQDRTEQDRNPPPNGGVPWTDSSDTAANGAAAASPDTYRPTHHDLEQIGGPLADALRRLQPDTNPE